MGDIKFVTTTGIGAELQKIFDETIEIRNRSQRVVSKILELKQAVDLVVLRDEAKAEVEKGE